MFRNQTKYCLRCVLKATSYLICKINGHNKFMPEEYKRRWGQFLWRCFYQLIFWSYVINVVFLSSFYLSSIFYSILPSLKFVCFYWLNKNDLPIHTIRFDLSKNLICVYVSSDICIEVINISAVIFGLKTGFLFMHNLDIDVIYIFLILDWLID